MEGNGDGHSAIVLLLDIEVPISPLDPQRSLELSTTSKASGAPPPPPARQLPVASGSEVAPPPLPAGSSARPPKPRATSIKSFPLPPPPLLAQSYSSKEEEVALPPVVPSDESRPPEGPGGSEVAPPEHQDASSSLPEESPPASIADSVRSAIEESPQLTELVAISPAGMPSADAIASAKEQLNTHPGFDFPAAGGARAPAETPELTPPPMESPLESFESESEKEEQGVVDRGLTSTSAIFVGSGWVVGVVAVGVAATGAE